jgi:hypothetical protein
VRYGSTIGVENNGGQKLFNDVVRDAMIIPLLDHNTNQFNKRDIVNGVEGLTIALQQGHWAFPCPKPPKVTARGAEEDDGLSPDAAELFGDVEPGKASDVHPEIQALIEEALVYDPSRPRKHTGDRLMAWWILSEVIRKSALQEFDEAVLPAADAPAFDFDLFSR